MTHLTLLGMSVLWRDPLFFLLPFEDLTPPSGSIENRNNRRVVRCVAHRILPQNQSVLLVADHTTLRPGCDSLLQSSFAKRFRWRTNTCCSRANLTLYDES